MAGNAISALINIFMIFTIGNWTTIPFLDSNGQMHKITLEQGGLVFMTLLKIGLNVLFIKWGCAALKTYKPIV